MKKKVIFSILLIIFSAFILLHKKNITDAAEQSPFTMYGYKISIMKYTGVGEATRIGKPILVYPKGMMESTVEGHPSNLPQSMDQLFSGDYNLAQIITNDDPETELHSIRYDCESNDSGCGYGSEIFDYMKENKANDPQNTSANTYNLYKDNPEGEIPYKSVMDVLADYNVINEYQTPEEMANKVLDVLAATAGEQGYLENLGDWGETWTAEEWREKINKNPKNANKLLSAMLEQGATGELVYAADAEDDDKHMYYEVKQYLPPPYYEVGVTKDVVDSYGSGICGYEEYIYRYASGSKTIMYTKSMIRGLDEFYKTYEVDKIGTAEDIASDYASTSEKVKKYFGIDIEPMNAKHIYVQVEVVQRVPDKSPSNQRTIGTFPVKKQSEPLAPATKVVRYSPDSGWSREPCESGYLSNGSKCVKTIIKSLETNDDPPPSKPCDKGYTFSGWTKNPYNAYSDSPKYLGSCTKKDETEYKYDFDCQWWEQITAIYYGAIVEAPSNIVTVRDYTGGDLVINHADKASNSCSTNAHCILNNKEECTNKYLYYVGPNEEEALVGPIEKNPSITVKNGNYPYKLNDAKWKNGEYSCSRENGTPDFGIQHFYWIEISSIGDPANKPTGFECRKLCGSLGNNDTDEYLKCAEQFADGAVDKDLDRTRAVYNKKKWIIGEKYCNYTYGKDPTDGSKTSIKRESVNSCNNSKNMLYITKTLDLTSTCNKIGSTFVKDYKASKATGCYGDYVTDFNNDISDDKPNDPDLRTYINKVCVDTTNLEFKDISNLKLPKGSGFTYPIMQDGEKECKYFFNLEQWKVDYASIPAREVDNRKRMLYILDVFNGEVTNVYNKDNYISDFSGESYGKTKFEEEGFNFGDTNISTTIGESSATKDGITNVQKILEKDKAIIGLDNKTATRLQAIGTDTVTIVEHGSISTKPVNRYLSIGEGRETYSFENVCISSDGLATISKAPSNNVCYERKIKNETQEVLAERKYYTNFNIGSGTNKVTTTVNIGKEGASYYNINETCKYGVGNCNGSCKLLIEPKDGTKIGNGQYEAGELNVKLSHDNYYPVKKISIIDNGVEHSGDNVNISIGAGRSLTVHRLVGKVVLSTDEEITCEETVEQYKKNTSCNASCSVEKVNENVYLIKTSNATKTYTYTSEHLRSTGSDKYSFLKTITDSLSNQGKYVRLSSPLEEGERLYGYVESSSCNNYCYYEQPKAEPKESNDCTKLFKPTDTLEVHDYCIKNWKDDVNGYKDSDDCINKCTVMCPNNRSDYNSVKEYCKNYGSVGFPDEKHCLNMCFVDSAMCNDPRTTIPDPENPDPKNPDPDHDPDPNNPNYIFRSINVWDPFPNSSDNPSDDSGRKIGENWQFFTEYITNDADDTSSVTGENMNEKVEYVIDLSPTKVRQVRKDTKENDLNITTNKRRVYGKLDRIKATNKQIVEEYKSKFIHNSEFSSMFKQNHGNMSAVYPK